MNMPTVGQIYQGIIFTEVKVKVLRVSYRKNTVTARVISIGKDNGKTIDYRLDDFYKYYKLVCEEA